MEDVHLHLSANKPLNKPYFKNLTYTSRKRDFYFSLYPSEMGNIVDLKKKWHRIKDRRKLQLSKLEFCRQSVVPAGRGPVALACLLCPPNKYSVFYQQNKLPFWPIQMYKCVPCPGINEPNKPGDQKKCLCYEFSEQECSVKGFLSGHTSTGEKVQQFIDGNAFYVLQSASGEGNWVRHASGGWMAAVGATGSVFW